MRIIRDLAEIGDIGPAAVALGNFDGVHLGHQAILSAAVKAAKEKGLVPAAFTFAEDPVNVIAGKTVVKSLTSLEEKAALMEKAGIELLVAVDLDDVMRTSSPEEFCRHVLRGILNARVAVCGFNYRFAYGAQGTPETLAELGKDLGYEVTVVPAVTVEGKTVSSTLLRESVEAGQVEDFPKYAGRPYAIEGRVVEGRRIGRTIGFPTVNLDLSEDRALPPNGVYITKTYVNLKTGENLKDDSGASAENADISTLTSVYPSVTNVGHKPTIGEFRKNAETHILNFSGDLYGETIRVEFLKMTRPERRFDSLDELKARIAEDKKQAQEYFRI